MLLKTSGPVRNAFSRWALSMDSSTTSHDFKEVGGHWPVVCCMVHVPVRTAFDWQSWGICDDEVEAPVGGQVRFQVNGNVFIV